MAGTTDILVRYKADVSDLVNESQKAENAVKEAGKAGKKAGDDTAAAFDKAGKKAKELKKSTEEAGKQTGLLQMGMEKLGGMIAGAFAIESVIAFGRASIEAFKQAELGAKKLEFAIKNIAGGSDSAFRRLIDQSSELEKISIFSDDSIQQAQVALAQYGLTADQIEKLTPKIIDLASATGEDLNTATSKVISAINGQTRGLKESGLAFDDTGTKIGNFNTFLEKSEKFAGATATALNSAAGAAANTANEIDNLQEEIGAKLIPLEKGFFIGLQALIVGTTTIAQDLVDILTLAAIRGKDRFQLEQQKEQLDNFQKFLDSQKKIAVEQLGYADGLELARKRLEALKLAQEVTSTEGVKKFNMLKQAIADINNDIKNAPALLQLQKLQQEDVSKSTIKNLNDEIKALKARADAGTPFVEDEIERRLKAIEKIKKANEEAEKAERERIKAEWEKKKPLVEAERERLLEQLKINQARMDAEIKKEDDKKTKAIKKSNDAFFKQLEIDARQRVELEKTWKDKLNEYYMDNYQNIQEMERQGLQVIIESQQKAYEAKQKGYDDQIALQEKNIQRQKELADKGLANTLAFEERKSAELQLKQKRDQQRQERLKKLEVFLNTYAESTKTMKPGEALAAALKAVALAELGTMLFAEEGGIIGEISARTGLKGGKFTRSHASGDRLVVASPNEAILSEKDMRALGGKQGFYDLRKMLHSGDFDMKGIPKMYQNWNPVGAASAINIDALVQEQKKTTEALKKIPVIHTGFDDVGNVIETWQKGLDKKITIIKAKRPRTA